MGFVLFWATVTDAWGYSDRFFNFNSGNYVYAYLSRLIWALPAVLLIAKSGDSLYLSDRQLFSRSCFDKPLAAVMIVSLIYAIIMMLANHQGIWFNNNEITLPLEIIKLAAVGFVEETVFRGWGYNALAKVTSNKKAAILSTAFFILLHWPAPILSGFTGLGHLTLPA